MVILPGILVDIGICTCTSSSMDELLPKIRNVKSLRLHCSQRHSMNCPGLRGQSRGHGPRMDGTRSCRSHAFGNAHKRTQNTYQYHERDKGLAPVFLEWQYK